MGIFSCIFENTVFLSCICVNSPQGGPYQSHKCAMLVLNIRTNLFLHTCNAGYHDLHPVITVFLIAFNLCNTWPQFRSTLINPNKIYHPKMNGFELKLNTKAQLLKRLYVWSIDSQVNIVFGQLFGTKDDF
jgi:hypothetical protein